MAACHRGTQEKAPVKQTSRNVRSTLRSTATAFNKSMLRTTSDCCVPNHRIPKPVSHRVEGQAKHVFELFLLARAKEQRGAVDVCDEAKSLSQRSFPDTLVVLYRRQQTLMRASFRHQTIGPHRIHPSGNIHTSHSRIGSLADFIWGPMFRTCSTEKSHAKQTSGMVCCSGLNRVVRSMHGGTLLSRP